MRDIFTNKLVDFLNEDIGNGDISSNLLPKKKISAKIVIKQKGIIAGINFVKKIFMIKNCKTKIMANDGDYVKLDQTVLIVNGFARSVLSCERTALNLLSRMSGIATYTNNLVKIVNSINPRIKICATRKTAPGLRFFDKTAVKIGGGMKHRMSLDEMIILKDNHIAVADSMNNIIKKAKQHYKKLEIEVENEEEAIFAAKEGIPIIMLDNFTPAEVRKTATKIKNKISSKIKIEVSGGINESNIKSYAKADIDFISVGSITNSVKCLDISLEVIK